MDPRNIAKLITGKIGVNNGMSFNEADEDKVDFSNPASPRVGAGHAIRVDPKTHKPVEPPDLGPIEAETIDASDRMSVGDLINKLSGFPKEYEVLIMNRDDTSFDTYGISSVDPMRHKTVIIVKGEAV